MEQTEFGSFLSQMRKKKGLTQKQLAEVLFVSDKTISRWECGLGFPDIRTLQPLSDVLDVSLSELLNAKHLTEPPEIETPLDKTIPPTLVHSEQINKTVHITRRSRLFLCIIGIGVILNFYYGGVLERMLGTTIQYEHYSLILYDFRYWIASVALLLTGVACLRPDKRILLPLANACCIVSAISTPLASFLWSISNSDPFVFSPYRAGVLVLLLSSILLVIALVLYRKQRIHLAIVLMLATSLLVLIAILIGNITQPYYPLIDSILKSIALSCPVAILALAIRFPSDDYS